MSINNPVIAAGPSVQKTDVVTTVCNVLSTGDPPPFTILKNVDGIPVVQSFPPLWHGQMVTTIGPDSQYGLMYIAVEQNEVLEWKSVNLRYNIIDKATDEEVDPFDGFY